MNVFWEYREFAVFISTPNVCVWIFFSFGQLLDMIWRFIGLNADNHSLEMYKLYEFNWGKKEHCVNKEGNDGKQFEKCTEMIF